MSAFALSRTHFDAILSYAQSIGWSTEQLNQIGKDLLTENGRSLQARYGTEDENALICLEEAQNYYFVAMPSFLKIKHLEQQVLKLINCTEYQCCEHNGWYDSTSCAFLGSLKKNFVEQDRSTTIYNSLVWEWEISEAHSAVLESPNGDRVIISDEDIFELHLEQHQARLVAYYGDLNEEQARLRYARITLLMFLFERQPSLTFAQAVEELNQYRRGRILNNDNSKIVEEFKHCRHLLQYAS